MRHMLFGKSGLRVSELCLGTMTFGDTRAMGSCDAESRRIFDAFAAAGGSFLDTADHYANGESELLVGAFMRSERDNFVIGTKWSASRTLGVLQSANGRRNMMRAVEASLHRLGTDRIDVYFLHLWDFTTPWEEILRGLDDLVRAGKILYCAISDTPAWEISRGQMLAELRGWSSFAGMQIEYNLAQRTPERDLLPMAEALGLGVTAWSPLAGGALSGKYCGAATGGEGRRGSDQLSPCLHRAATEVACVANEIGATAAQVAIAWVRQQGRSAPIIPILGARTVAQIEDNLRALEVTLDADALKRLDTVSRIDLGFPHDLLRTDYVRSILQGGASGRLRDRTAPPHPVANLPMSSGVEKT